MDSLLSAYPRKNMNRPSFFVSADSVYEENCENDSEKISGVSKDFCNSREEVDRIREHLLSKL